MKKIIAGCIVLFVVVYGGLQYGYQWLDKEVTKYVTMDINPSIQLALNRKDKVLEVLALNDDADIVLSDLDLVGLDVEEAAKEIIDSATETGYIDEFSGENAVVVAAYTNDEKNRLEVQEKIMNEVKTRLEEKNIYGKVETVAVTDEIKEEAEQYDVSNGKMLLIQKAVLLDSELKKEDLVDLSIKEIQEKIKEARDKIKEEQEKSYEDIEEERVFKEEEVKEKTEEVIEQIKEENKERIEKAKEEEKPKIIEELLKEKKEEIKKEAIKKEEQKSNNDEVDNDDDQGKENSDTDTEKVDDTDDDQGKEDNDHNENSEVNGNRD